jgi:hypothetical protein
MRYSILITFKEPTELVELPEERRTIVIDFVNQLIDLAKHFGINIDHKTLAVLYEPLFIKQTMMEYDDKLTAFEYFIDSVMTQIRERLNL